MPRSRWRDIGKAIDSGKAFDLTEAWIATNDPADFQPG